MLLIKGKVKIIEWLGAWDLESHLSLSLGHATSCLVSLNIIPTHIYNEDSIIPVS